MGKRSGETLERLRQCRGTSRARPVGLQASLEIDRRIAVLLAKHDITYTQVDHGYHDLDSVLHAVLEQKTPSEAILEKGGVTCT